MPVLDVTGFFFLGLRRSTHAALLLFQ